MNSLKSALIKYQRYNFAKVSPIKPVLADVYPLHEHKEFRNNSMLRKQKTKLMTYPDSFKPFWMKLKQDDPFDYKLRSKEDVYYQMFLHPPYFPMSLVSNEKTEDYIVNSSANDNKFNLAKVYVRIKDMGLFPLQQQRLIFLLGRRYKQNGILKIVSKSTDNFQTNEAIAYDTIKQLYLESLRAPLFILDWMTKDEQNTMFLNFGPTVEKGMSNINTTYFDKTTKEYKKFQEFYSIIMNPEVKQEVKLNEWGNLIKIRLEDSSQSQSEKEALEKKQKDSSGKLLTRSNAYKELEKKGEITKKAYDMFFKDNNI